MGWEALDYGGSEKCVAWNENLWAIKDWQERK